MDILTYLVVIEMLRLRMTAAEFNSMEDKERMAIYNEVRFSLKAQLRNHPDILTGLDRRIADILFAGCPESE